MDRVGDILKTTLAKKSRDTASSGQLTFDEFTRLQLQKAVDRADRVAGKKRAKRVTASDPAPLYSIEQTGVIDPAFIAREFALMGLPHSDPGELRSYTRRNGRFTLRITADQDSKLPYGVLPRILLVHVATEAVRTKTRFIHLGNNLSELLRKLDMPVSGGPRGSITALKEQAWRLFTCEIAVTESMQEGESVGKRMRKMLIADEIALWWHPKAKDQEALWESYIEVSEKFYDTLIANPVPVDWNTVRQLRKSPLALDLYFWLTHRMSYLNRRTTIAWAGPGSLAEQVGSSYDVNTSQGKRDFRKKVTKALRKVVQHYRKVHVETSDTGITLFPSPTHVSKRLLPAPSK